MSEPVKQPPKPAPNPAINPKAAPGKPPAEAKPAPPPAGKGKAFFERAEQVAETGNWDFAVEMYLQGIQREPENVARGHQPLREVSLKRKAKGGKGPSLIEQMKLRGTKAPLDSLINAEHLLAKEPGDVAFMEALLKAAVALQLNDVIKWICDIMMEAQKLAKKKTKRVLMAAMNAYEQVQLYTQAIRAGEMAHQLDPRDDDLFNRIRSLGASETLQKGKYGQEGDFSKGVKDMDKQKALAQGDLILQNRDFLQQQVEKTRADYLASPTVMGKINAVVDALVKIEEEAFENEAIDILTKAFKDTQAYQYKMRIGDIRMKQLNRRARKLIDAGDKAAAKEHYQQQLHFELEEYLERAANYPTDMAIKFELGLRQLKAGKYDDSIASLQVAQRDPRRHLRAMNLLGQAFAAKGWYREAAETYEKVLGIEMPEERAKEIRYHYGDVLEKMAELQKAYDQFSQVAQIDFNYRDVRQRMDGIRKKMDPGGSAGTATR